MSWPGGTATPLVYQLTATPGWTARKGASLFLVNDWLFLYGGSTDNSVSFTTSVDDLWLSSDLGSTWSQLSMAATGTARHNVVPVSVNRRMLIMGGDAGSDSSTSAQMMNDVSMAFW